MKKVNCIVVDDEPLARDVIENYISRIESVNLIASCKNVYEAFNILQKHKIDLIFLDIHMPEIKGTDFFKELNQAPAVIFTTAYSDYAAKAYDLGAIDYLVKPIEFTRFLKSIGRVLKHIDYPVIMNNKKPHGIEDFIYLKIEKKLQKIFLKNILYIESSNNNIKVKMIYREVIAHKKISEIYESLPKHKFIRVHRSFIISIDHIDSFSPVEIEIKKIKIPVGRKYRENVKTQLGYY
ncbi:LytR/AlgR family response regulator transcription factor [Winogradskyella schleiferi]|uniref:LytR/AlgR family response regulator transcription factor n=1 Tax=Winogradskyella schleiferi TaxID=2686078 RepID=UPI0015BAA8DD|nr:LytTR family DNA-binding domain-containing protein [Winogradskyella schleiferi]